MGVLPATIKILAVWMVGWAVWLAGPADAYVLSGPHILELMISKYGKARRLLVLQKQFVFAPGNPKTGLELNETVRYVFPDTFRSDLQSQTGERVYVLTKHGTFSAIDGKIVNEPEDEFDRYKDIFLYHSREVLHRKLRWLDVEVSQTSLGRFQDKIAFVIGAQYPDETLSQLWVEKETFRPMRWLTVQKTPAAQTAVLEIQYRNWQLFADNWYPLQIIFIKNGHLAREIRVQSVQAPTNFPGHLFDIQGLRKRFQPTAAPSAVLPGTAGAWDNKKNH